MTDKKELCYSGIGGQAVLEGIMMKNQDKYAIAVRKPEGEIEVKMDSHQGLLHGKKIKELPFIRGIFNFVDSLVLGMKCLNFSASFYEEEEDDAHEQHKEHKACSASLMQSGRTLYILYIQLPSTFQTIDTLMFRTMIHIQSFDIFHGTDSPYIQNKNSYPDQSFNDRKQ